MGESLAGWRTAGQVPPVSAQDKGRALHGAEAGGRLEENPANVTDHDHFYKFIVIFWGFVPADDEFRCRQAL